MNELSKGKADNVASVRQRKILWRANHRGMRELDIILGGYAKAKVGTMNDVELDAFEAILDLPEPDLFRWLVGLAPVPDNYLDAAMQDILDYRSTGVTLAR